MSWADSVVDDAAASFAAAAAAPRPTRPSYVPPHLRSSKPLNASAPEFNPSVPALPSNRNPNPNFSPPVRFRSERDRGARFRDPNPNHFDVADKFNELGIAEGEIVGGGGGINFDAYDDIPVDTSGQDVPPPASSFAEIDLGEALNRNIAMCKYVKPTPVQRHAIPISMAGRDLMACAQTGSGKTAAFCFPIISGIMKEGVSQQRGYRGSRTAFPLALILSPTRELSSQVCVALVLFVFKVLDRAELGLFWEFFRFMRRQRSSRIRLG